MQRNRAAHAVQTVMLRAKFNPSLTQTTTYRNRVYQDFKGMGLSEAVTKNFLNKITTAKGAKSVTTRPRPTVVRFRRGK